MLCICFALAPFGNHQIGLRGESFTAARHLHAVSLVSRHFPPLHGVPYSVSNSLYPALSSKLSVSLLVSFLAGVVGFGWLVGGGCFALCFLHVGGTSMTSMYFVK